MFITMRGLCTSGGAQHNGQLYAATPYLIMQSKLGNYQLTSTEKWPTVFIHLFLNMSNIRWNNLRYEYCKLFQLYQHEYIILQFIIINNKTHVRPQNSLLFSNMLDDAGCFILCPFFKSSQNLVDVCPSRSSTTDLPIHICLIYLTSQSFSLTRSMCSNFFSILVSKTKFTENIIHS